MYYGDLGKRIFAAIIDGIIVSLSMTIIGYLLVLCLGIAGSVVVPIVCAVGPWMYYILMEGGSWHATLGKRMMGLYVADSNGDGITYSVAILRLIGKMLSGLILGIGYLMAFFDERKQGLHDMIAKSYVLSGQPNTSKVNRDRADNANGRVDYANGHVNNANDYASVNQNVNANEYARMPELIGISGPLAGKIYQISNSGLIIGRDSISCQVVIPASQAKVSRIHCYVTFNPMSGMFIINDRNSTHGTFLTNGGRISYERPVALKSGGRFYLATPDNTFEVR